MTMFQQVKTRMLIEHAQQFYQAAKGLGMTPKKFVSTLAKSEVRESPTATAAMAQVILIAVIEHSIPEDLTWEQFEREIEPLLRNFIVEIMEAKP